MAMRVLTKELSNMMGYLMGQGSLLSLPVCHMKVNVTALGRLMAKSFGVVQMETSNISISLIMDSIDLRRVYEQYEKLYEIKSI